MFEAEPGATFCIPRLPYSFLPLHTDEHEVVPLVDSENMQWTVQFSSGTKVEECQV